jgi:hypothetical protein
MKWLKFVFVIALVAFSGSCLEWFIPVTTYYFVVTSGCTTNGMITHSTPNGGAYHNGNIGLTHLTTVTYRFQPGTLIILTAGWNLQSMINCQGQTIRASIMECTVREGQPGHGGTNADYQESTIGVVVAQCWTK